MCQNGASLRVDYFFGDSVDDGLSFKINTLDFVTMILWCRVERNGQVQTCMKSFSVEGETASKGTLFACFHLFLFQLFLNLIELLIHVGEPAE